jgi:alpha-L-rhamnosidase
VIQEKLGQTVPALVIIDVHFSLKARSILDTNRIGAFFRHVSFCVAAGVFSSLHCYAATTLQSPGDLICESLETPLGIDTATPRLSWQLNDSRPGARQSAYQLQVATAAKLLESDKPDVWDSGRIESNQSVAVAYEGPALKPSTRYFWRVKLWDTQGAPYPASPVSWWETGLMETAWSNSQWIGSELPELKAVRESKAEWISNRSDDKNSQPGNSRHDFRFSFSVSGPVKAARLYVTGKDTVSAWVNGTQVLEPSPLPPYKQTPWKKYVRQDVTSQVKQGKNDLAVEVLRYDIGEAAAPGTPVNSGTPMSLCLYIENDDGSSRVIASNQSWKATLNAGEGWNRPDFNDSSWPSAISTDSAAFPEEERNGRPWPTGPVMMLRHAFDVGSPVRSARLYATAMGAYKVWINGQPVGNQVLAPGWTDYRDHIPYQTYDVTALIQSGDNVIGAWLAPGWYSTPLRWIQAPNNYGATPPAFRAQLRIEHADGSVDWIKTDPSWKSSVSPIQSAEIYDGETYDARLEQAGWSTPHFDDAGWHPVETVDPKDAPIVAQDYQPIRIEKTLYAKTLTEPTPGVYVFDFGQNMAGVAHMRLQGKAGQKVRLRFSEVLNSDGTLYTENLRTALVTDYYTFAGRGSEDFEPSFTFHGFRYVEVTGLESKPALASISAKVFHTDAPFTIELHSGSPMLNQLWSNILWGQRSNFVGIPTDCPQRDERLGWTGDAEVFWRAASYNMSLAAFSRKFSADLRSTQGGTPMYGIYAPGVGQPNEGFGAGWSDAGVIVPWTSWLQSGDTRIVDQNWEAMSSYLAAIEKANPDYLWKNNAGIPFGDWLSPEGKTKAALIQTAYWAYDVTRMREMAHATGRAAEEQRYAELFGKIQQSFASNFIRKDGYIEGADNTPSQFGRIFSTNKVPSGDTQTGYVLALYMNLVPSEQRQPVAEHLVGKIRDNGWKLGTGFLGTPYLLAVLTDTGHADVAYRLLLNTEYPSWGYLVGHGATTMWERWNGDQMRGDPSMNSYNHYAYGAVADWVYRYGAGIDTTPLDSGFHTIYLHPNFDRKLGSLAVNYDSPYGRIHSAWKVEGSAVTWTAVIPPNTVGVLPVSVFSGKEVLLGGRPLAASKQVEQTTTPENGAVYKLEPGTYTFVAGYGAP